MKVTVRLTTGRGCLPTPPPIYKAPHKRGLFIYTSRVTSKTLKIAVASFNPVKLEAVKSAFSTQFPQADLEVIPVSVSSGVSDQPLTDAETRQGARNRVENARQAVTDADYWVGLEGGVESLGRQLMAMAWMAVGDASGSIHEARSPNLPLPPGVQRLMGEGLELGEANDVVFATSNSKQGGGAYGLLTDGRYTRQAIYAQTLEFALIPLVHELWRQ